MFLQIEQVTSNEILSQIEKMIDRKLNEFRIDTEKEYITVKEAAQLGKVSEVTIYDWLKKGAIARHKFGRRTLIKYAEFRRLINEVEPK